MEANHTPLSDDEFHRARMQAWYRTMCRVLKQPPCPDDLMLPTHRLEELCLSLVQQQEQRYQAMRLERYQAMRRRRTRRRRG